MLNISQEISSEKSFKNNNTSYEYMDVAGMPLGTTKTENAYYLAGDDTVLDIRNNIEMTEGQFKERMDLTNNLILGL